MILTTLVATSDLKKYLYLQVCKYKLVKKFLELMPGQKLEVLNQPLKPISFFSFQTLSHFPLPRTHTRANISSIAHEVGQGVLVLWLVRGAGLPCSFFIPARGLTF